MSQMFVLPSLELLLIAGRAVALVLGLLIFAWAFRHWRRAASRDTQRVFEQLDLVRSELLIMKEVMHHSAHRGDAASGNHAAVNQGSTRHSPMYQGVPAAAQSTQRLMATPSGTARGYEIAARMARNGAGKDELIRSCGITGHEAELLVKLHGQRRAVGAELIGKQPRVVESTTGSNPANSARQPQLNNPLLQTSRQAAATPRQTAAATSTQRTVERAAPAKSQSLPPRSRLVAVG
jgi:hypothetical protein